MANQTAHTRGLKNGKDRAWTNIYRPSGEQAPAALMRYRQGPRRLRVTPQGAWWLRQRETAMVPA